MTFINKSYQDIYRTMESDLRQRYPELNDFTEGSVLRTMLETLAFEQSVFYQQLDSTYKSAFINSASGSDLDKVVEILDVKRNEPDYASGTVTFEREKDTEGQVIVPFGTLLLTEEDKKKEPSKKAYLTIEEALIPEGENFTEVKIRAVERGRIYQSDAETIIRIPRPVSGIKSVINHEAVLFLGRDQESDDELRERAKKALLISGLASTTSIEYALLAEQDVRDVNIVENLDPDSEDFQPGVIRIYIDGLEGGNSRRLKDKVDEVRAAGIYPILSPADKVGFNVIMLFSVDERMNEEEKTYLEEELHRIFKEKVQQLRMGEDLILSQLFSEFINLSGINDISDYSLSLQRDEVEELDKDTKFIHLAENERLTSGAVRIATGLKNMPFQILSEMSYPKSDKKAEIAAKISTTCLNLSPDKQSLQSMATVSDDFKNDEVINLVESFSSEKYKQLANEFSSMEAYISCDPIQGQDEKILSALKEYFNALQDQSVSSEDLNKLIADSFKKTITSSAQLNIRDSLKKCLNDLISWKVNLFYQNYPTDELQQQLVELLSVDLIAKRKDIEVKINATNQNLADFRIQLTSETVPAKKQTLINKLEAEKTKLNTFNEEKATNEKSYNKLSSDIAEQLKLWSPEKFLGVLSSPDNLNEFSKDAGRHSDYLLQQSISARTFDGLTLSGEIIPGSIIDQPVFGYYWLYHRKLFIKGSLKVALPLNMSDSEKETTRTKVLSTLQKMIAGLKPEEDLNIKTFLEKATKVEHVMGVTLGVPEFQLALSSGEILDLDYDGESLPVGKSEKMFLDPELFRIEV